MERRNKGSAIVSASLSGVMTSVIILIAGSLSVAWLMHTERAEMESLGYWIMGLMFMSGVIGAVVVKRKAKEKLLISCTIFAVALFLILLCAGALLFEGRMEGLGVTLLLIAGTAFATMLVGINRNKNRKYGRHSVRTG